MPVGKGGRHRRGRAPGQAVGCNMSSGSWAYSASKSAGVVNGFPRVFRVHSAACHHCGHVPAVGRSALGGWPRAASLASERHDLRPTHRHADTAQGRSVPELVTQPSQNRPFSPQSAACGRLAAVTRLPGLKVRTVTSTPYVGTSPAGCPAVPTEAALMNDLPKPMGSTSQVINRAG